jgi:hypothetical protein
MRSILLFIFLSMLVACRHNKGASNEFKDAKTHPSEQIGKGHKKAADKADHDFKKNQRKSKKAGEKKNAKFFKKKRFWQK